MPPTVMTKHQMYAEGCGHRQLQLRQGCAASANALRLSLAHPDLTIGLTLDVVISIVRGCRVRANRPQLNLPDCQLVVATIAQARKQVK